MPKKGLGRGLDALLSVDIDLDGNTQQIAELSVALITAGQQQPRKNFELEALQELADSIREHGMIQPILVRPAGDVYEIIAGERRYRAAKMAGLESIPAVVREISDVQAAEISLIENLQREDLTPVEEAQAYKNMVEKFAYTQETLAQKIGKSRTHVTNTMRILSLPGQILQMIEEGKLSAGHARTILSLRNAADQMAAAQAIINEKLSVRETEKKVKIVVERKRKIPLRAVEIAELEEKLEKHFGTRTEIINRRKGGKIEISYYSDDDLERIIELMGLNK